MPRIPTYDQPTVAPQAAPVVMMPNAPAGAFGESVGEGLSRLGAWAGATVNRFQEEANQTRVEDAVNQSRQQQLEITNWARGLNGQNALDPTQFGGDAGQSLNDVAAAKFESATQDIAGKLANPAQKQMFQQYADRLRLDLMGQVQGHVNQQADVVRADAYQSGLTVEQQNVDQNGFVNGMPDEATLSLSLKRMESLNQAWVQQNGLTADHLQAANLKASTAVYASVLGQMLQANNPEMAKGYLAAHEKDIEPAAVANIRAKIENDAQAIMVGRTVDGVMALNLPMDKGEAEIRARLANNPEAQRDAIMDFDHRFQVQKTAEAAQTEDAIGKLWDMRFPTKPGQQAVPFAAIRTTPEWGSLDGAKRNQLRAQFEAFAKRNENDPAAQEALAAQKFATYWAYASQPDQLKGMTDAQIMALTPKMGLQGVQALLQAKQTLQAPGKVLASSIDTDQLKVFASQAGMKVYGTLQPADDQRLGLLKMRVDQQIEDQQQAIGRELSRSEKNDIIKRNVTQYQMGDPRGWYNPARWFGDSNTLPPEFGFELKPGDKLAIPDDVRAKIVDEAHQHGVMDPTEQQIQNRYFQMQQPAPEAAPRLVPKTAHVPTRVK